MPQFCILFYANYIILATQRGGMAQWPPPKYAPDGNAVGLSRLPLPALAEIIEDYAECFYFEQFQTQTIINSNNNQKVATLDHRHNDKK